MGSLLTGYISLYIHKYAYVCPSILGEQILAGAYQYVIDQNSTVIHTPRKRLMRETWKIKEQQSPVHFTDGNAIDRILWECLETMIFVNAALYEILLYARRLIIVLSIKRRHSLSRHQP